jgi:hypothetical protein
VAPYLWKTSVQVAELEFYAIGELERAASQGILPEVLLHVHSCCQSL